MTSGAWKLKTLYRSNLYVALIHYPVLDKNGKIIVSAVTNLDLHDIARVTKTYGVKAFYVITPLRDQARLVYRILEHWIKGFGATYNPKRREALELIRVKSNYDMVLDEIKIAESCVPETVATTARDGFFCKDYHFFRDRINGVSKPYVIAFGTAWGLADEFIQTSDHVLGPIVGPGNYNHLSVRSAVSIVLDRILGC